MHNKFKNFLEDADKNNLRRTLKSIIPFSSTRCIFEDREYINFSSNDYLGLNFDERLRIEAIDWMKKYGSGAGASRLVTGSLKPYLELEERIAEWKNTEAALIFGSGFLANSGIIEAITSKSSFILADKLNHASLNSGCRLSNASFIRYSHSDMNALTHRLEKITKGSDILIVSDTVFSMDGDITDIPSISKIASEFKALIYFDEAHSSGLFGKNGSGLAGDFKADFSMSTFSKAMGSYGSCLACSSLVRNYIINKCGTFIYSTALPPGVCGSISKAVELVQTDEFEQKRRLLAENSDYLRYQIKSLGFKTGCSSTQIIPIIIGDNNRVLEISDFLRDNGILAVAIRPPTVPQGTARIRLSLSCEHTRADIDRLLEILAQSI